VKKRNSKGKFVKGQSGNPAGRPVGARGKATVIAEKIMLNDIEEISAVIVSKAKEGDFQFCKLIMDRLAPVRDSHFPFHIEGSDHSKSEIFKTLIDTALNRMRNGEMTLKQFEDFGKMIVSLKEVMGIWEDATVSQDIHIIGANYHHEPEETE
jgi:hypothetical protein